MNDTQELIGQKLNGVNHHGKDAIHVAVLSVIINEDNLKAGDHLGIAGYSDKGVLVEKNIDPDNHIGILDPFLKDCPQKGDSVYLFLFPNTVTDMVHQWTHPVVDKPSGKLHRMAIEARNSVFETLDDCREILRERAEKWLRDYADNQRVSFSVMMDYADDHAKGDVHWEEGGILSSDDDRDAFNNMWKNDEFWNHYEIYREIKVEDRAIVNPFTCSC